MQSCSPKVIGELMTSHPASVALLRQLNIHRKIGTAQGPGRPTAEEIADAAPLIEREYAIRTEDGGIMLTQLGVIAACVVCEELNKVELSRMASAMQTLASEFDK